MKNRPKSYNRPDDQPMYSTDSYINNPTATSPNPSKNQRRAQQITSLHQ